MITAKRQKEITTETHSLTIVRFRQEQAWMQCALCGAKVPHLRIGQAAATLSLSETAIFRLAEAGHIHSIETPAGLLMLCSPSLAEIGMELEKTQGERK